MKNGILTTQENESVLNYNSSDNIEYRGMKLSNYLDLLNTTIKNISYTTFNFVTAWQFSNYTLTSTSNYENLTATSGGIRSNSSNTPFVFNNDGSISVNGQATKEFVRVHFEGQVQANTAGTKFARIYVERNGQQVGYALKSISVNGAGQRVEFSIDFNGLLERGDKVRFQCYGNTGDQFNEDYCSIEAQQVYQNDMIVL